jgi:DNA-binding LytR/AlgR family response regulator
MTKLVIADDEPLLRFHLQKMLDDVWPECDIMAQAANGEEAWALIQELEPDVAFLDIHMPGLSGLDVALKVAQHKLKTRVVFLTAYDQYALDAFDRGAVDYLLKPLDENRLEKTITRLSQLNKAQSTDSNPDLSALIEVARRVQPENYLVWLNAQKGEVIKLIHVDEVLYFRAEDKYTTLVTETDEFLLRLSIKQLEEQLNPDLFWRVHRSTLVNVRCIDRVEKTLSGHLQLYLKGVKNPLGVSRAKQALFKAH